jgi:D-inositol-3-phosphate glycosyltransferase
MDNCKGHIALISVHGDPLAPLRQDGAGGQNVYVKKVGEALAQRGWKIDLFTRRTSPDQPEVVEHFPGCRTIRIAAGPPKYIIRDELFNTLPEFVEAFLEFQHSQKILYPLIHTNYWLSGWVGLQLRKRQFMKLVHTYHSLDAIKYRAIPTIPTIAKTRLNVEKDCLEAADCVVATSSEERADMQSRVSANGNIEVIPCGIDYSIVPNSAQLDELYTAQLNCLHQEFFQQNSGSRIGKAA